MKVYALKLTHKKCKKILEELEKAQKDMVLIQDNDVRLRGSDRDTLLKQKLSGKEGG